MMPSEQYVGFPACVHAIGATAPVLSIGDSVGPRFSNTDDPLPSVTYAMPGEKHRWAKSDPCESPITPQMGIGRSSRPSRLVSPKFAVLSRTSGKACIGTWNISHSEESHRNVEISNSSVRLALV